MKLKLFKFPICTIKRFKADLFEKIKEIKPDFIVLTGDLIDKKTKDYNYVYSFIEELIKVNVPVYSVSGNHDLSHKDFKTFNQELVKRGVVVLDEEKISYKGIDIYGLGYYSGFKELEIKENNFSLGLIHDPMDGKNYNFDLVLSGHTHGGQVRIPFIGAIFIPGQGFFAKYDKGLFEINEKTKLYIDSGLGNTFLPIRFLNQSQISFIRIHSK